MARVLNALQLALGGVGAGMSSYGRSMIDREERLRREAQQEEMNAINRLNALRSAGFGVTTLPEEEAPAQAGTFSMPQPALPSSSLSPSVMGKALARATQQGMGVSERPTGTLDTPIRTALNATPVQPPARPTTPTAKGITVGGMRFGLVPQEVVAQREQEREMEKYRKQVEVQEDVRATSEARRAASQQQQVERIADLYSRTYADAQGRPLSKDMATVAAMQGKTPLEMGFIEKPMSPQERVRYSLDMQRLNLSEREYALKMREQDRRESDSARRRDTMPAGAQRRLEGLDSGVLLVGDVREMLKATPDAVGPVKGRMLSSVIDAIDKQGVGVRAAIEAMSGEIRNQRFGGALSANEAKFAERFLPDAKDNYETAISKIDQLEKFLETKRKGVFMTYQQPYRPIYAGDAPPKADNAANPYR